MTYRRRDVPGGLGLGLGLGLRVGGPLLGGGLPTLLDWNVEILAPVPTPFTYARNAPVQSLTTIDGLKYWYQELEADEIHYSKLRRAYNHMATLPTWSLVGGVTRNGDDFTWPSNGYITQSADASAVVGGANIIFSIDFEPAPGTTTLDVRMRVFVGTFEGDITVPVAASGVTKIQTSFMLPTGVGTIQVRVGENIKTNDTYTITNQMLEFAQNAGDPASDAVSYTGVGFQSAQWFATTNGNSVVAGVVTLGAGSPLVGGQYLPQHSTTNLVTDPDDLSTVNWTLTNILTPTDLDTDTIGLRTWLIDAGVAAGAHTIGQAIVGTGDSSASVRARIVGGGAQFLTLRLDSSPLADYAVLDLVNGIITEEAVSATIYIENLGGGWFEFGFGKTGATAQDIVIGISDTGAPGTAEPSFTGANEQFAVCIPQVEAHRHVTAPVVGARAQDDIMAFDILLTDEVSVVADTTIPVNPTFSVLLNTPSSNNQFYMANTAGIRSLVTGSPGDLTLANATMEGERHRVALSWKDGATGNNIVDDEGNDNTLAITGMDWSGRDYTVGYRTTNQVWNGGIHRFTIYSQAGDVDTLKDLTAPP